MVGRGAWCVGLVALLGCGEVVLFESVDAASAGDAQVDGAELADAELADGSVACTISIPAAQCTGSAARVCFENVGTCPGAEFDIVVHIQGEGCPPTQDQGGGVQLGPFELVNAQNVDPTSGRCLRRNIVDDTLEWGQLSSGTLSSGCPESYERGVVDRIRLRAPADIAPGDYRLAGVWGLIESVDACGTMSPVVGPTVRIGN